MSNKPWWAAIWDGLAAFLSPRRAAQELDDMGRTPAPLARAPAPPQGAQRGNVRRGLVAIGVSAPVAAALFVLVPQEESGRVVDAKVVDGGVVVEHVKGAEHRTAYRDIVGVLTICDGDTANVRPGQVASREECLDRLERQLIAHTQPVLRCVPGLRDPARGNQLLASVSLAYNIGPAGFCRSTAARRFNAGQWRAGCDAFLMWNKAGGRVVRGLTLRRQRERAICLRGL